MTSKEKLEKLLSLQVSIVLNKACCKPQNKLYKETYDSLLQDIERLEELEKIFSDSHICEIKARFNEIECTSEKCDSCPLGIGDDICLKHTFEKKWELQKENQELEKENKKINEYQEHFIMLNGKMADLERENEKLKKVIEIAIEKNVRLGLVTYYNTAEDFNYGYPEDHRLTYQEFDLIKEVLENVD